jgi:hypothetical protein
MDRMGYLVRIRSGRYLSSAALSSRVLPAPVPGATLAPCNKGLLFPTVVPGRSRILELRWYEIGYLEEEHGMKGTRCFLVTALLAASLALPTFAGKDPCEIESKTDEFTSITTYTTKSRKGNAIDGCSQFWSPSISLYVLKDAAGNLQMRATVQDAIRYERTAPGHRVKPTKLNMLINGKPFELDPSAFSEPKYLTTEAGYYWVSYTFEVPETVVDELAKVQTVKYRPEWDGRAGDTCDRVRKELVHCLPRFIEWYRHQAARSATGPSP